MPAKTVAPDLEDRVLRLYAEGFTRSQVAEMCGISEATVTRIHQKHGVPMRGRGGANNVRLDHMIFACTEALYLAGYSEQETADILGISRSAVNWRLARMGTERRSISESVRLRRAVRQHPGEILSMYGQPGLD